VKLNNNHKINYLKNGAFDVVVLNELAGIKKHHFLNKSNDQNDQSKSKCKYSSLIP
jgi:hypothetical protein